MLKRYAAATSLGMLLLLVSGVLVTTTGSAAGCGNAWPFCDGDWSSLATWIEVNHRLVTGVLGLMVASLSILAWRAHREDRDVRWMAGASVFFLLLQSWLGAAAVMWGSTPAVLATHFGVSLAAFGAVFLLGVRLDQLEGRHACLRGPVSPAFHRAVWGGLALTMVVVYAGAYLRHTHAGLACLGWPLCGATPIPPPGTPAFLGLLHRLLAGLLLLVVAYAGHLARRFRHERPDLFAGSVAALGLLVAQALSGALVIATRSSIAANVLHSALLIVFAASLLYLGLQITPQPAPRRQEAPQVGPVAPSRH
ncbi:MAG: heme A synthase [Limnochordaceae bacterium]|nr:heme A synthase [Limnochordaceae bacterium]